MMETLYLNDGTVLEPAHVILSDGILWVYIDNGISIADAFALLIDSEKTQKIVADEYGITTVYEGYTELFCITKEIRGQVNAGLKKAVD